jgi:branched-chain amino acid transport system substrate-binding protein
MTSTFLADSVCDASKDMLVGGLRMKSAVVMSEDAAWTTPLDDEYLKCLPTAGLKVLDHIRFSPDTTDFTPIFNKIEGEKPDVIMTGISHVGVQPTVQWAQQQVPFPMFGISSQATSSTFWKDTNGAADGVIFQSVAAPGAAITPTAVSFTDNYTKRFGITPAYCGNTAYDEVYYIADAIKRAGSTDPDKMVAELEKTDYVGTIGRVQFYGKDDAFPHAMKQGAEFVPGLLVQWQDGKQVTVWPPNVATAQIKFPSFVKLQQATN